MSGQSDRPKKRVLRIQDHYSLPCEDSSRRRSRSSSPQKYFIDDEDEDGNENYPEFRRADEGRHSYASREDYGRRSNSPGTSGGYRRRLSVGDDDEDAFRHRKGYSYEEKYEHKLRNYEEMRSHEEDYRRLSPRRSSDYERTRLRDSIGEGSSSKFGGGYEERRSLGTFEKHEKNPFQFHNDYEEFLQSENFEHQSGGSYERQLMQDYDRQPIRDYEGLRVRDYEGQSAEDYFEDHRKERRLEEFEERRPYSREGSEEGRIRNLRSSRERSIDYNNLPFERSHDNKLRRGSHERTRDNELRRESHERSRDSELRRRSRERSRDNISRRLSRQRSHDSRSPGASHEIISRFPHERSRDPDTRRRSRERSRDEINRSRRSRSREKSRDRTDRFPRRRYRDSPPRRHSRENSREVVNRRLSRRRSRDSPQERRSREILRSRRSSEDERLGTSPRGDLEEESSADLRNFIRKKKSTKQLNPGENILMRRHLRENYATSISPTSSRSRSRDKSETNFYFGGDEKDSENIADLHKSPERNSAGSDQEDDPVWDRKESYAVRRLSNLIKNSPTYEKCLKIRDEVEASTSEEYREPYFLPQYSPKDMGDEDESEGIFDLEPPLESTSTRSSKEDKLWDRKSRKEDRGWNSKEDKLRSEKAVREEKFRSDKISEDELRSRRTSREDKLKSERSAREDKFRSERSARESQRPMREDKPRSEGSTREDKLRRERSTREDELKSERMRRGDMLRSERSTREDELKSERIRGEDKSRSERSTREDELKSERSRREDKLRNERSTREDELKSGRTRREDKIRSERSRKEDVIKSERLRKEDKLQNQKSSREESLQCREGSKEDTLRNQNVSVLGRTTTGRQNEPRHDEELSKSRSKIAPTSQKSSSITSKSSIPKSNYSKGPLIASTPSVTTPQHISSISTSNTTKPPLISQRPISTIVNIETYPRGNQQQQRPAFNTSNSPMMNVQQGPPFMSPNSSMVQQRPSFTSPNSSMELQQRLPIICSSPQMIGLQQQPLISSAPYTTMNRPLLMTPNLQISPQHIPPGQQILNFQTRPYHIPQQNSYPQIPQMTQRPPFIPSGPTPMNLQYRHFNPTINLTIPRLNPPTSNYSQRPVLMNNQQIRTSATANRQTTLKDLTGNKKPVPTPTIVKQINQDNQPQSIANLFGDEILKQNILGKKPKIVNRKTPSIANPVVSPNQKKLGGNVAGLRSGKTAQVSPMKGSVVLKDSPKALAMKKQDRFRQLNDLKRRAQKIDFTEDEVIYQVKPKVPVYSFPKYSDNVKTVKGSSNAPKKSCQDIKKEATKTSKGNETNSTMNSPKSKDSCGKLLKSTDSVKLKTPTGKRLNDVQVNSNNHKKQKTDDSKQEMTNAEMVADILSVIINNASKADNLFTKEIVTTEITNISGDKPNDEVENLELVSDESVSEHKSKRSRKKKGECWLMKRRLRRIEFNKKKKLEKSMGINIVKPGNSKSAQNKTEMKESDIVSTIIENSTAGKENLSCDQELSAENIVANIISSVINKATKVDDSFSEDFEDVTENLENEDFLEPNVSTSVEIPLKKPKRKSLRNILRGRKRRSHYRKKNKGKKESLNAEVATPKTTVVHRDTSKVLLKKVRSNRKSTQNKMDDIASPIMNQEAQIDVVSCILNNSAEANKSSVKNLKTQAANETSVANKNVITKDSKTENNSGDLNEVSEIFTREVTSEIMAGDIISSILNKSSVINKATKVDDSFSEDFEDVTENLENEDFSEPNVSTSVKIPLKKSKRKSLRNILRGRKRRSHYRKKNKGKKESSNAEVATPKTKVVHRDTSKVLSKKVRSNRKSAQNKMDDIASPIMNQEAQIEAMVTDVSSILNNSAEANKSSVKNLETQVANETSVANENVIIKDSETENNSRDLSEVSEIFTREVTSEIIAGDIISSILSKATETNNFSIQESREKNLQVHEKAILEKITEESQEKTIKETREKITEDETTQKSQEESTQEKTTEDETTLESQEESTRESQVEKKEETTLESQKESTQESQVETIGKPQEKSTENPQEIITRESREKQKNDDDSKQEVSNEEMVADILSAITNNATKVNNLFTEEIITTEETNISGDEVQNENMTTDIISTNTDNAFDEVGNLELVSDESVSEQKKRRSTKSRGKNWLMKRRLRRAEFNKKKRREKSMGINFSGVANIQKPQEKKLQVHEEKAIRKKTAEESQEKGTEEHDEEITRENHDESTRESEIETIRESQENTTEEHEEETTRESQEEFTRKSPVETIRDPQEKTTEENAEKTTRESQEESTRESRVETIREPQEITTEEHEEDETIRESQDEFIKEFQVETIRDPQEKTTEENEEETARESQEECTRESQVETIQESQEKTTEEHEEQTTRESQEECTQEYQIETIPEPGEKNTRESQEETIRESQEECTQEYQIETISEPREKITQESQEETIREPQEKNTQEFNEGSIREPHKKIAVEAQEGATEEPQVKSNEGFQKEISREYHEETTCEVQEATTQEPKEIISQDQREKGNVSENSTEYMLLDSVPIKTASITAAAQNSGEIEIEEARYSKNLTQNEENAAADIISSIIEADISGDTNLDTFLDSVLVQISSIAASNLSARKSKEVDAEVTKSQENVAADAMNKSTEVSSFGEGLDQNVREKNLEGENDVSDNVTEIKEIDVPKNLTEIEENDVSKNTTEIEENDVSKIRTEIEENISENRTENEENDVSKTMTEIEEKDVSKNLTEIKESDVSENTTEIEENVLKNFTEIKESDVSKNSTEIEENDVSTNITEIEENDVSTNTTEIEENDVSKNTTEIEENDVSKNTTEIEENNVSENLTGIEENVVADVISAIISNVTETNITPFNPAENIEDTKFSIAVDIVEDSSLIQEVSNENVIAGILTTILKNATGGNDDLLGEEQKSLEINQITDFINDSFKGDVSPTNKERLQKSDEPSTKKLGLQKIDEPSIKKQGLQKTDEPSIKKQGLQKTDEPSIKKQKLQIIDEPLTKKRALQKTDEALTDKETLQKSDEPSTKKQLLQVDNKSKSVESPTTEILSELDSIESNPKNVDTSRDAILNPDIFVVEKVDLNSEKGDKKIEDSGDLISKLKNVVVVSNIIISPPRPDCSSKHQEKIMDIIENSAEKQDASTENVIAGILSAIINNITKESDLLIRKENDSLSFKEQDHFEDESAENVVMGILSTVINNSTKADESLIENDGNNSFDRICKEIKIGDDNLNLNQEESTEKVVADIISNIIYRVTRKNRVRSKNKNKSKSFNKAKSERMVRQIIWEIIDKVDTSGNAGQNVYGNGGKRGQIFNAIVSHFTKSTPTQNKKSKQNKPSTSSSVIPSTSAYPPQVGYNQLPLPNVSLFPYAANRVGLLPFPAPPIQNRKRKINEPIQNSPKMKPLHYSTVVNPIPSTSTPKKLSKKRRKRMRKAALAAAQTKPSPSKQANDEISAESESEEIEFKKKKSNTSFSDEEMKKYGVEIVLSPYKSINIRNHVFRSRRQDTVPEIYRKPMDNSTGLNFFTRNTYIKHMFL